MNLGRKAVGAALVFALLIALNILAAFLPWKADFTEDKLYSLSPGTERILEGLQEPVQIEFFYSSSIEDLPVFVKNYADRVREMLRQYASRSGGKIELSLIDPKPDTPEEERATRLGLQGQQLPRSDARLFLGIVVTQADQRQTIPFLVLERERFLEYDLSQLIYSVQRVERPKLGLISGLPLAGRAPMPWAGQQGQPAQLVHTEAARTFEIVPIEQTAQELPADLAVLAVIHPQELSERLQFAIDQFILSGKPTFIAVDPANRFLGGQSAMMMGPPPGRTSSLPRLFSAYGIEFDAGQVLADESLATQIPGADGRPFPYPLLPTFKEENLAADSPLTSQLQQVMMIEGGSLSVTPTSRLVMTPLLSTSARSGQAPSAAVGFSPPEETAKSVVYEDRTRVAAAFFRGEVTTAFPDGRPAETTTADGSEGAPPAGAETPALKTSSGPVNLFIAADADWLMDAYSVRRVSFLGTESFVPLNDNLGFAVNLLEAFGGSDDLVSIRGKNSSIRPFERVDAIERAAQQRFQVRLDELEEELRKLETQINEVLTQQSEQRLIVTSPELEKNLQSFRDRQVQMRAERREIRRALREEIERLESRIVAVNLIAVPLLVAGLGIAFFIRRSRRRLAAAK